MSQSGSDTVLAVENLGKRYSISHRGASRDGLRHVIESAVRSPMKWLRTRASQNAPRWIFGRCEV